MTQAYDVIIVGGGIVGLTAALAMAERGFSVAVIDAGSLDGELKATERVYAINHASKVLFEQLGVWALIDESRISPYQHMHVWDSTTTKFIDFDSRVIASQELGVILEESAIKKALLQKIVAEQNITCFPGTRARRVLNDSEVVTVSCDDTIWKGRLLMIADGAKSPTRNLLNVPITSWPYHQHALVATVNTEKAHLQTAYQVFNPDGPLAFLPLVDNHQCSIVWSTTRARALTLLSLAEEEFNHELGKASAHKLGNVRLKSSRHQFPLIMRHTQRYVGKNWLLLGDAAHTIHPLAGLGLNVGLADVAAWLSCLAASNQQFTSKALGAYQRERKYAVWQIIALMSGLKTLFANPLPPIAALRGFGLELCNRITPLKRLLIEQAAGKPLRR